MTLMAEASTTRTDFESAVDQFNEALNAWKLAADSKRDADAALRVALRNLDVIEAQVRVIASLDGRLSASNEKGREAQLIGLLQESSDYKKALAEIETAKTEAQRWTNAAEAERDRLSLNKRVMDWTINWIRFLGNEGGESNARTG